MPSDEVMAEERYHYFFINNVFGNFYKDILDYFSEYLYPRFQWTVVGTYHKAVEYIDKESKLGREADMPMIPALILNPSGEFNVADASAGGRQLWRFPNLAPGLATRLFEPIYVDDNIEVNVCFSRFKGEIELIMLLHSFYEYCDIRVLMIQVFGGLERIIYPSWFNTFIIFEDNAYNYLYENEVTGESYKIDWESHGVSTRLVKSTARNEKVFPCRIKPLFKLTSLGDGSEKYGGTDKIAEWKLTATIEYEVEMPTFMTIQSDVLRPANAPPPSFSLSSSSAFSVHNDYAANVPVKVFNLGGSELNLKTRYFHQVTADQVDSTSNIEIELPESIDTTSVIETFIVMTRYGKLDYRSHYKFKNNGCTLEIFTSTNDTVYLDRSMTAIQELQPDGTYVKKLIPVSRYIQKSNGTFVQNANGNLVPIPQTTYSMTIDNRFIKDSSGEYVKRNSGEYERRTINDFQELITDMVAGLGFKEGDIIEFYVYELEEF